MAQDIALKDQYYLTRAQYNAKKSAGELVVGGQYYITDENFLIVNNHVAQEQLNANATAVTTLGTSQVRNITISTTDLTPGTSSLTTGDIYLVYEV